MAFLMFFSYVFDRSDRYCSHTIWYSRAFTLFERNSTFSALSSAPGSELYRAYLISFLGPFERDNFYKNQSYINMKK